MPGKGEIEGGAVFKGLPDAPCPQERQQDPPCAIPAVVKEGSLLPGPAGAQSCAWACVTIISPLAHAEFGPGNEFLSGSFTSEPCSWAGCWLWQGAGQWLQGAWDGLLLTSHCWPGCLRAACAAQIITLEISCLSSSHHTKHTLQLLVASRTPALWGKATHKRFLCTPNTGLWAGCCPQTVAGCWARAEPQVWAGRSSCSGSSGCLPSAASPARVPGSVSWHRAWAEPSREPGLSRPEGLG